MPLIAPGMVSGALFAFITSFDELVVAMFPTGPGQRTLPRQMFDGIRENMSPTILAVATILTSSRSCCSRPSSAGAAAACGCAASGSRRASGQYRSPPPFTDRRR
ncbi:MAG: hypothetical protein R3D25_21010 [Geminicoccaceae bacterium]